MRNCTVVGRSSETKKVRRSTAMLTKEIPTMGEAVVRVAKVLNGEIKQPKTFDQNGIYCLQSESEHLLYGGKSRNVGQRLKSHNYTDFKGIEHDGMLICSCKRDWDTTFMNANERQYIQALQIYAAMFGYTIKNKNKIYKGALNDLLSPSDWEVINAYLESHKVA